MFIGGFRVNFVCRNEYFQVLGRGSIGISPANIFRPVDEVLPHFFYRKMDISQDIILSLSAVLP